MPHQHKWSALTQFIDRISQFEIDLRQGARLGTRIAPSVSGAVVGTDARELGDAGLHQNPVEGKVAEPVLYQDGRTPLPGAIYMQPVPAKINEGPLGRRCGG